MPLDNEAIPEVRTRRLIVVDEAGQDRIVAEVTGDMAEIRLIVPGSAPGRKTSVALAAGSSGDESVAGLVITIEGNVAAEVIAHRRTGRWRVSFAEDGDAPEVDRDG